MRMTWRQKSQSVRSFFGGCHAVKRFKRNEDGITAIEFSLVALPFFAILGAIIETGLYFFVSQVMDNGFREATRLIRTGQATTMDLPRFKNKMCALMNQSSGLFNCGHGAGSFYVSVETVDWAQAAQQQTPPLNGLGQFPAEENGKFVAAASCGGAVVLARAYYVWPVYLNLLGSAINQMPNGHSLLTSITAFRNEPFGGC